MASRRVLASSLNAVRQAVRRTGTVALTRPYGVAAQPLRTMAVPISRPRAAAAQPVAVRNYSQEAANSKIWSFEDVQKLAQDPKPNVVIVDVREPGELQSTGHIPHAINIPVTSAPDSFHITDEEFEDRFGYARPSKEKEVVFYCKAGVRSRAAAGLAREAGWKSVGEYPGSWLDWHGKGGKIQK